MRSHNLIITVAFLLTGYTSNAQQNYMHSLSKETYQDLSNPVMISKPDSVAENYYQSLNFLFPAFGAYANFRLNASVPSQGAFITRSGYFAVYESPGYNYTDVFQGYYNPGLRGVDSSSSIAYQVIAKTGGKLVKFQWKNMRLINHPASERVNFQIWLDEVDQTISYHYGPSNISADTTNVGVIGIFRAPNDFHNLSHATNLTGDASTPDSLNAKNPASLSALLGVLNFPPTGTVITFINPSARLNSHMQNSTALVFPNPAMNKISVSHKFNAPVTYEICTISGNKVSRGLVSNSEFIDISNIGNGLYYLVLQPENKRSTFTRFVIYR